jgi:membrane protein implicated in regulation of membrane protease activity
MPFPALRIPPSLIRLLPISKEQDPLEVLAIVVKAIKPGSPGSVQFQGTTWRAQCPYAISLTPDTQVKVIDRQKLTLIVVPLHLAQVRVPLAS